MVINLECVKSIDEKTVITIVELQKEFGENNASFIICLMQPEVEKIFEKFDLLERIKFYPNRKRSLGYCSDGRN